MCVSRSLSLPINISLPCYHIMTVKYYTNITHTHQVIQVVVIHGELFPKRRIIFIERRERDTQRPSFSRLHSTRTISFWWCLVLLDLVFTADFMYQSKSYFIITLSRILLYKQNVFQPLVIRYNVNLVHNVKQNITSIDAYNHHLLCHL